MTLLLPLLRPLLAVTVGSSSLGSSGFSLFSASSAGVAGAGGGAVFSSSSSSSSSSIIFLSLSCVSFLDWRSFSLLSLLTGAGIHVSSSSSSEASSIGVSSFVLESVSSVFAFLG